MHGVHADVLLQLSHGHGLADEVALALEDLQLVEEVELLGGLNALDWANPDKVEEEVRRLVPYMKRNGGYIYATDHSVPDNVSFKDFKRIMDVIHEVGKY